MHRQADAAANITQIESANHCCKGGRGGSPRGGPANETGTSYQDQGRRAEHDDIEGEAERQSRQESKPEYEESIQLARSRSCARQAYRCNVNTGLTVKWKRARSGSAKKKFAKKNMNSQMDSAD